MAAQIAHNETDSDRLTNARDYLILMRRPPGVIHLSNRELNRALRLALLCESPVERMIIGLHLYRRIPVAELAPQLDLTPCQIEDHLQSLQRRKAIVEERGQREATLSRVEQKRKARG